VTVTLVFRVALTLGAGVVCVTGGVTGAKTEGRDSAGLSLAREPPLPLPLA